LEEIYISFISDIKEKIVLTRMLVKECHKQGMAQAEILFPSKSEKE
jgi:hypothetical protein